MVRLDKEKYLKANKRLNEKTKKSPLKNNPLRTPGQSLDEEIQETIDRELVSYVMFPMMMSVGTIFNWLIWYEVFQIPNPILTTFMTVGVSIYCVFRIFKVRKRLKALRLGRDGEKAVGQTLDALREKGYRIFHDLVGEKFNLDHVIVNEHGVFSIETKTYSKPEKGECKIIYSEDGLSINGYKPEKKDSNSGGSSEKMVRKTNFNINWN